MLQYAMAKSDSIPQLEIFKGHCKPIWLFIASGKKLRRTDADKLKFLSLSMRRSEDYFKIIKIFFHVNHLKKTVLS